MVFLVNFQLEFPLPLFSTKLDTLILWVGTAKACINGSDSVERKNRNIAKQLAPYLKLNDYLLGLFQVGLNDILLSFALLVYT